MQVLFFVTFEVPQICDFTCSKPPWRTHTEMGRTGYGGGLKTPEIEPRVLVLEATDCWRDRILNWRSSTVWWRHVQVSPGRRTWIKNQAAPAQGLLAGYKVDKRSCPGGVAAKKRGKSIMFWRPIIQSTIFLF
jgi:hypothetical protein